jgi:coenzyme Q-binding protein COQ10
MPVHTESKYLPYTAEQMFDLVADVERYPEFLPWVMGARIKRRDGDVLFADLMVGFKMVREQYTSRVALKRPYEIDVTYTEGPFRRLENHWKFTPADGGCRVDFYLDFEFRSRVLQRLIGSVFSEAVRRMVGAFESRAKRLYGPQSPGGDAVPSGGRA